MTKAFNIVALLAMGLCSCTTTESSPKKETYTMQKGGMSSQSHEMAAPKDSDSDADNKKKESYRMEKGGMSSQGHEMK